MPDLHFSIEINRSPEAVFNSIADLANYRRWLPPSKTYAETIDISDLPIKAGTTYRDKNTTNIMLGEVRAYTPYSLIVFHQATEKPSLDITIRYELSLAGSGTRLARTTTIATFGLLRLIQPILVRRIRQENERTLQALKAYLES
ncbi:MAG TPA: SRPBCC family protein [Anaerolineales bacterium]